MDQLNPTQQKKAGGLIAALFILFLMGPMLSMLNPALAVLAEHYQIDAGQASYLTSICTIPQIITAVVSGFIVGKKVKFKTWLIVCLAAMTFFGALPGIVPMGYYPLLACRALYGFFLGGIQPIANASVIMHFADEERRAKVLGYTNVGFYLGLVIFLLLGGILAGVGWNMPFLAYLFGIVAIATTAFLYKEPPNDILAPESKNGKPKVKIPFIGWAFMIGFCVLQIIYMPLMMLAANIMEVHQLGDSSMAGMLMAGSNIVGALAAASFGTLFKLAKKWLLVIAWVFEAVGFAGVAYFAGAGGLVPFAISFVVIQVFMAIMTAGTPQFISMSISPAAYAVAMGLYVGIYNVGSFLASPFIQGSMAVFGTGDFASVFWASSAIAAVMVVIYAILATKFGLSNAIDEEGAPA